MMLFLIFFDTGDYLPKESIQTISNAMDVGNPSNMDRIMDMYGSIDKLRYHLKQNLFYRRLFLQSLMS